MGSLFFLSLMSIFLLINLCNNFKKTLCNMTSFRTILWTHIWGKATLFKISFTKTFNSSEHRSENILVLWNGVGFELSIAALETTKWLHFRLHLM